MSGKGTANEKNVDQPTAKDEKTPTSFGVGSMQATISDVLKNQTPTMMSQATGGLSNTPTDHSTTVDPAVQNFNATAARALTEHANKRETELKASPDATKVLGHPNLFAAQGVAPELDVSFGESAGSSFSGNTATALGFSTYINPGGATARNYGGDNTGNLSVDSDSSGYASAPARIVNGTDNQQPNFFGDRAYTSAGQQTAANTGTALAFTFTFPPAKVVCIAESGAVEYGTSIVTVRVGHEGEQKSFAVYESILCARSTYCRGQLAQSTMESKAISLTDHHSDVFSLYLQLIYTNRIPTKTIIPEKENDSEFERLCNLDVLALNLKDLVSQNLVIDALHVKSGEVATNPLRKISLSSREDIETVFLRTTGQCGGRRLLVDLYASKARGHWMHEEEQLFPHEFVSELAMSLLDTRFMAVKCGIQAVLAYYDKAVGEGESDGEQGEE